MSLPFRTVAPALGGEHSKVLKSHVEVQTVRLWHVSVLPPGFQEGHPIPHQGDPCADPISTDDRFLAA